MYIPPHENTTPRIRTFQAPRNEGKTPESRGRMRRPVSDFGENRPLGVPKPRRRSLPSDRELSGLELSNGCQARRCGAESEDSMKTFYLQDCEKQNRMIIHSEELTGCVTDRTTQASSWLQAKKNLGFELTPMQEELRTGRAAS